VFVGTFEATLHSFYTILEATCWRTPSCCSVVDDDGDDLIDRERQAVHEALLTSWSSAEAGRSGLDKRRGIVGLIEKPIET
jgi:hypothetical protein